MDGTMVTAMEANCGQATLVKRFQEDVVVQKASSVERGDAICSTVKLMQAAARRNRRSTVHRTMGLKRSVMIPFNKSFLDAESTPSCRNKHLSASQSKRPMKTAKPTSKNPIPSNTSAPSSPCLPKVSMNWTGSWVQWSLELRWWMM